MKNQRHIETGTPVGVPPPASGSVNRVRKYLVVYGPPCSGKTLNASAMCAALGYDHAFDANFERAEIRQAKGRIILFAHEERVRDPDHTGRPYRYVLRKKPIEAVKRFLGARWVEPSRNTTVRHAEDAAKHAP